MNDRKQDAALIRSFQKGNDRAFEQLLKKYERPLYAFVLRFVNEKAAAEDLFQQIWIKVLRAMDDYHEKGKFGSWLFGIAHNACIDFLRSKHKALKDERYSESGLDEFASQEDLPDMALLKKEQRQWLEKAIQELPDNQKEVLLLRIYGDMSFKDIADRLQCPLNTVLGRMHYAVGHLKKKGHTAFGGG